MTHPQSQPEPARFQSDCSAQGTYNNLDTPEQQFPNNCVVRLSIHLRAGGRGTQSMGNVVWMSCQNRSEFEILVFPLLSKNNLLTAHTKTSTGYSSPFSMRQPRGVILAISPYTTVVLGSLRDSRYPIPGVRLNSRCEFERPLLGTGRRQKSRNLPSTTSCPFGYDLLRKIWVLDRLFHGRQEILVQLFLRLRFGKENRINFVGVVLQPAPKTVESLRIFRKTLLLLRGKIPCFEARKPTDRNPCWFSDESGYFWHSRKNRGKDLDPRRATSCK